MKSFIPAGYQSLLSIYETQKAISLLKRLFEDRLGALLNLYRVSAPLFVAENSGLNDNLNGVERPVSFDILRSDTRAEVVQSLAKWKRLALKRYDFHPGKGLYTDMNAIRRDEDELDNLHSVYVDQWDWEKVIRPEERNLEYLRATVRDIVRAICDTQDTMEAIYPQLGVLGKLSREVSFVTAQELEDRWPDLSPKERENACLREYGTVFIQGIGEGLGSFRRMKRGWLFLLYTFLIWILYWFMSACIVWALKDMPVFGSLTLVDALFISLVGSISSIVPIPGGFGIYHGMVSGALQVLWGIPKDPCMAFAVLNHESQVLTQAVCGLVSYIHESFFRKK